MSRVVDTDTVRPEERFDFWVEAILRTCFPLTLERRADTQAPFHGSVRQYCLGPLTISRVCSNPMSLRRTRGEIRSHDPGTMQVSLQVGGRGTYVQGNSVATATPGTLVVYDTARPFAIHSDAPTEVIVVETSKDSLGSSVDWARAHAGEALRDDVVAAVIAPFLTGVMAGLDAGVLTEHDAQLGECALNLLRTLCNAGAGSPPPVRQGAAALRSRIKVHIDEHLDDPALSTATIARAHFISTRYLQKLFKAEGLTVTGWIRERRMAGARRDLRDPARADESIMSIAARWGLTSSAHFSRTFRAQYGRTPSEVRAEALGST